MCTAMFAPPDAASSFVLILRRTVMVVNVAVIHSGLSGGASCFNLVDEPSILVSLAFNFLLGKCCVGRWC